MTYLKTITKNYEEEIIKQACRHLSRRQKRTLRKTLRKVSRYILKYWETERILRLLKSPVKFLPETKILHVINNSNYRNGTKFSFLFTSLHEFSGSIKRKGPHKVDFDISKPLVAVECIYYMQFVPQTSLLVNRFPVNDRLVIYLP